MKYEIYKLLAQNPLGNAQQLGLPKVDLTQSTLNTVLSTVFYVLGGLTMIFVVVGGLKYVLSGGNPEHAKKARETILYALIGLLLTLSAYLIVTYILSNL